jgi:hypothetical protein
LSVSRGGGAREERQKCSKIHERTLGLIRRRSLRLLMCVPLTVETTALYARYQLPGGRGEHQRPIATNGYCTGKKMNVP